MFHLSNLPKSAGSTHRRVGRGEGSNRGKNAGKGHKGQNKHGQGVRIGFEGGQKPLIQRVPKYSGFNNPYTNRHTASLTLVAISKNFVAGETVSLQSLKDKKLVNSYVKLVRIVKTGELPAQLTFAEEGIYLTKGVKSMLNQS